MFFCLLVSSCVAQQTAKPVDPTSAVVDEFRTHDVVMFGEIHWEKSEWQWLEALVSNATFDDRVDDIVMEIGNSLYQKSVDRYVSGEAVPIEDVQRAWQNTLGLGPPSPLYAAFYRKVREVNLSRRGKHQIRILCGDLYIDWEKAKTAGDVGPFLGHRDEWYAQVVKDEVLAKHHRALLIAGSNHFIRQPGRAFSIEDALRQAGARTFVVLAGSNAVKGYDDLDSRFNSWPVPSFALVSENWVGELLTFPVVTGGTDTVDPEIQLKDAADALLYLGPRDGQMAVHAQRSEVDGTPYGKELLRRMSVLGFPAYIAEAHSDRAELMLFPRPAPVGGRVAFPVPPNMEAPLPPRPPSR